MSDALNYLIKAHPGRRGFSGRPQPAKNARRQQREYQAAARCNNSTAKSSRVFFWLTGNGSIHYG
jgi:hypothetical protein